jgi:dTDP-glucose 4,6-dehydratase
MNWTGRPVLVTGAAGFIGSHLAERLVELGAQTRAFVHYNALDSAGWLDESPVRARLEVVAGDLGDRDGLRRACDGVDIVFHLAALIAIPYSYRAPVSYVRTNVEGTLNVLQAALDAGARRVIHTSTSEVYGTAQSVPIGETHPLSGQSPYAATKIGADKIAEAFHRSFNLPIVTVRPFNTYGPRQSARAIVPTIVSQVLADRPVQLGNVTPTRDLTFVADTVSGFIAAAEADKAVGGTFNLGTGREIAIGDLASLIGRIARRQVSVVSDSRRVRPSASEVERLAADNRLAREVLGWTPRVTLEEGLDRTIRWMADHQGRFRPDDYVV